MPSLYVTTTTASFSPAVFVSTGSLKVYDFTFVNSSLFFIPSSAFTVSPTFADIFCPCGSFFSASVFATFSQTAYTVLASEMFAKIPSSAFVASDLLAQPRNLYPSLVGAVGAVTVLSSFVVTPFVVVASSNLPPFASKVTSFSSDHTA